MNIIEQAEKDYKTAQQLKLTKIDRWQQSNDHYPLSERLVRFISKHDFEDFNDFFCWKIGGDGDNGETLMYQLDTFFEMIEKSKQQIII